MRYPPGKLPEIVNAYSRDDLFFAAIRLSRVGVDRVFELGISQSSYAALQRVFQTRPFDTMPGVSQRYFFVPSIVIAHSAQDDPERRIGTVRIEQGHNGRDLNFPMPKSFIANLLWFYEMETLEPAQHLRSWPPAEV